MPGIRAINDRSNRTSSERSASNSNRKDVFFKDGDQAFMIPVATGDDNDPYLDEFWMYTFQDGSSYKTVIEGPNGPMGAIPEGTRPSHKFAFWAYVTEIFHSSNPRNNDYWQLVSGPGGQKMFKEEVNAFRVVTLSMGRSNSLWNQLVDVYSDWGSLSKGVIRIRRKGEKLDTTYTISATPKEDSIPESMYDELNALPSIKEYMLDVYSEKPRTETAEIPATKVALKEDDFDSTPWDTEALPF